MSEKDVLGTDVAAPLPGFGPRKADRGERADYATRRPT